MASQLYQEQTEQLAQIEQQRYPSSSSSRYVSTATQGELELLEAKQTQMRQRRRCSADHVAPSACSVARAKVPVAPRSGGVSRPGASVASGPRRRQTVIETLFNDEDIKALLSKSDASGMSRVSGVSGTTATTATTAETAETGEMADSETAGNANARTVSGSSSGCSDNAETPKSAQSAMPARPNKRSSWVISDWDELERIDQQANYENYYDYCGNYDNDSFCSNDSDSNDSVYFILDDDDCSAGSLEENAPRGGHRRSNSEQSNSEDSKSSNKSSKIQVGLQKEPSTKKISLHQTLVEEELSFQKSLVCKDFEFFEEGRTSLY